MMNNKTENRKQNIEHLAHLEKQEQNSIKLCAPDSKSKDKIHSHICILFITNTNLMKIYAFCETLFYMST